MKSNNLQQEQADSKEKAKLVPSSDDEPLDEESLDSESNSSSDDSLVIDTRITKTPPELAEPLPQKPESVA
jgi:hypothetical protein